MQGVQPPSSQIIQPGVMPSTNAGTALFLSLIGVIGVFFYGIGLVFSILGLVIANKAKAITTQIPGHPDSGTVTSAIVLGWIGVIIGVLYVQLMMVSWAIALDSCC